MSSLFDNPDATGNTQDLHMSGSQGSIKREGSRGVQEPRRQLPRTVSRTKQREGGVNGLTTVVPKPKKDGKVDQKSLSKIMLKAIFKTHQTMRDLSSTVWDIALIKKSSPEADDMQKQARIYAEKVRFEGRGHTGGPPFVWVYLVWLRVFQNGTEHSDHLGPTGTVLANADLRQGSLLHAGQNVLSRHQESDAEHRLSRETALRSRSTQSNRGRAQVRTGSTHSHGTTATFFRGR